MEKLHPNIVEEIVSRVPPESIVQAKLVCKTWLNILSNKKYGILMSFEIDPALREESSVELYYGDFDDIINYNDNRPLYSRPMVKKIDHPPIGKRDFRDAIIGSCNGLVCFSILHQNILDPVHICNPFTGEYFNLPRLHGIERYSSFVARGFGYLQSTNEYKVLRIYYPKGEKKPPEGFVQVYTLGDGRGWRNIEGTVNYMLTEYMSGGTFGPNGAINFITKDYKIVGFDLREEKFRVLPSPSCFHEVDHPEAFSLRVLGGDLCFIHSRLLPRSLRTSVDQKKPKFVDIWSFKQKEGCWNWSKDLRILTPKDEWPMYDPFFITKKHEVVLWEINAGFFSYDPKTKTTKKLVEDNKLDHFEAILHMNTNISLRDMGVRSKMRRRKEEDKIYLRFFKEASEEERQHAEILMEYQQWSLHFLWRS